MMEGVIRHLGRAAHLHLIFVDDLFDRFVKPLGVIHIPAERGEEGVDELQADRGLAERGIAVLVVVALEKLDKLNDLGGCGHRSLTVR